MTPEQLKREIAVLVDATFAEMIVNSYLEMQQRYYAGDWGPAELDGGKFCESVARAVYQLDSGAVIDWLPGVVVSRLQDKGIPHKLDAKQRDHFCRVLQTTYKFRNDRGVAHVSPTYNANHLDATLVVTTVKWMFAEFLRLAWNKDPNEVATIIEAIIQLEHPLIHELDGRPLVLSNKFTTPEEVLVLLQNSPGGCLTRTQLKDYVRKSASAVNKAINELCEDRYIRLNGGDVYILPPGVQHIREIIKSKAPTPIPIPMGAKGKP
jgi:hypothetical protein